MTPDRLVAAEIYVNAIEAEIAQSALEAAGIDAIIAADDAGGLQPHLQMRGVALLVRADDLDEARRVLTTAVSVDPSAD